MAHMRGPLQSAAAQWAVLGLGAFSFLGNEENSASLLRGLQMALQPLNAAQHRSQQDTRTSPIVIHTTTGTATQWSLWQVTVVASLLGVVGWSASSALSTLLPDSLKEWLPVTRKFFDYTINSLGKAIVSVKEVLTSQIEALTQQHQELQDKQDAMHTDIRQIQDTTTDMQIDLQSLQETLQRCEASLADAEQRQSYTARGVQLLVRCVAALLPANSRYRGELDQFGLGEEAPPPRLSQSSQRSLDSTPENERYLQTQSITRQTTPPQSSSSLDNGYSAMLQMMNGIEENNKSIPVRNA